jgi:hypothetical protein
MLFIKEIYLVMPSTKLSEGDEDGVAMTRRWDIDPLEVPRVHPTLLLGP